MKVLKPTINKEEERVTDVEFNIFKFTNRSRPSDPKRVLIFSSFSEFGCEIVSVMFSLPKFMRDYPGKYTIAMGWYGRAYLYKHLVDEFWEIKEEYQWLRDYARAFHHDSKNLLKVEEKVGSYGMVITAGMMGQPAVVSTCLDCRKVMAYTEPAKYCRFCGGRKIEKAFFADVKGWNAKARRIPKPSEARLKSIEEMVPPMSVGIFARARKTYGRNLQPEFYVGLIKLLESMNYKPIWLGEKQNTLPCPVDHIMDFSRMPESRDLETTLAIISKCMFTIQFWTASTRLASMMGVPYILAESPDQIWGNGQEGYRRNLCDFGPSKLIVSHYLNAYNDNEAFLNVVKQAILEVEKGKYDDVFGQLDTSIAAQCMKKDNQERIGGIK